MFDENKKEQMMRKLEDRLNRLISQVKCPMCGDSHFKLSDAYIRNELQEDLRKRISEGSSIPSIAIICDNCGFISQHALSILGLTII